MSRIDRASPDFWARLVISAVFVVAGFALVLFAVLGYWLR
jgi:hypothetical protein